MRWFSKKIPNTFSCIIQVGDTESKLTVSEDLLDRLIRATKQPALGALDQYFGDESWCSEIATDASLEGPVVYFNLTINSQPGQTAASMTDIVVGEFRRRWDAATRQLLK